MDRPNWYEDDDDSGPRSRLSVPPLRTWSGNSLLLLTLVVMLFLQLLMRSVAGVHLQDYLGLDPSGLANPLRWYQFVTYALLHDETSLLHLGFNCLLLWFLGPPVEAVLRTRGRYLAFCAVAAAVAGLAYVVEGFLSGRPPVPMIGASGICYAVLVAFATYDPQRQIMLLFPPIPIKAWALAAILMGASLLWHMMQGAGGVAHIAHLGGGVFGFLFIRHRGRLDRALELVQEKRIRAQVERERDRRREIDRILDKISRSGIGSLSRAERRFLESASKDYRHRR